MFNYRYGGVLTIAVEIKTTLSDFKKDLGRKYDFKKQIRNPVHLFYLAMPKSIVDATGDKFYRWWGNIICSNNGEKILKVEPQWFINPLHSYEIIDLIAQVAIRRDHRTRYRVERDWWKMYRAGKL